uniref:Ribosomal RNA large subunit methyltransferase K/L-like methyltransferase domain-containing protein n=1 Tax=Entomoneis paludosa TaxID=265537 RepID=A0A7S2YLU9_9STRA
MPEEKVSEFNEAMQYVRVLRDVTTSDEITQLDFVRATQRCSLVHALYQVVSRSDSYEGLSEVALQNGNMIDMQPGKENQNATWCFRVRHYGQASGTKKQKRHGDRTRSVSQERIALKEMTPLFMTFGGAVDLENPDCKLYVFDGVKPIPEQKQEDTKILTRQIATGPQIYRIAPNTRICVTNTPLCPIASYLLCNAAGIRPGQAVLDPFGGSCATLLAASMIANVRSVSIEIAHNGYVNRDDILLDFETRQLTPPLALIHGDSTDPTVREKARQVLLDDDPKLTEQEISSGAFDCIVTDPPYGIRESTTSDETNPIQDLLLSIEYDRDVVGKRLLKKGGKLVAFLPCTEEQSFEDDAIPSSSELERAGLRISQMREQKLNDVLSRWLVVFDCVT